MKLYYLPGACSLSPHIISREAGLDLELVRLQDWKLPDGRPFTDVNPKGYVPALELDNGQILTEGAVIVQYLADLKPDSGLVPPAGSFERYRQQEWLVFVGTEIHKTFGALFHSQDEGVKQAAKDRLGKRFGYLAPQLKDKPYLTGDRFTAADAYLFTVLGWASHVNLDLSPWPELVQFRQRVSERPAVQAALQAEGLLTPA